MVIRRPEAEEIVIENLYWQNIEGILHRAFDLPLDERQAYIDAACGDDETLRGEICGLLMADRQASGFLVDPGQSAGFVASVVSTGDLIGAYRVLEVLGQGGMGVVYLAERADGSFKHRVALKVNFPSRNDESTLRRLRQERQILAGLEHPNIARLVDGGKTEAGAPYFVMEHVDGKKIDEYCDARRLSVRKRLDLFLEVCGAVRYAHQNLIVHRDLKPSNILVTERGVPKLLDFGIAKVLDVESFAGTVDATRTGLTPMTPRYASPEQLLGKPITTASDVYSLGVLLYELLTGCQPMAAEGKAPSERISMLTEGTLRPPSAVVAGRDDRTDDGPRARSRARNSSVKGLQKSLSGDLDNILLKALRWEPTRRYGSVGGLAEDLRRYLEGQPVKARPETFVYVAGKFIRRHRVAVSGATAALLMIGTLSGAALVQSQRLETERDRVLIERDRTALERDKAKAVSEFLTSIFEASDHGNDVPSETTARELLERGAELAEVELKDRPHLLFAVLDTIGGVYVTMGLWESSKPLLRRAVETGEHLYGPEGPELASPLRHLGLSLVQSDLDAGELLLRRAVDISQSTPNHPELAESLYRLGTVLAVGRSDYRSAAAIFERALDIAERLEGAPLQPEILSGLSRTYLELGDSDRGLNYALRGVDWYETRGETGSGDYAGALHNLGVFKQVQGDNTGALELYLQAIRITESIDPMSPSLNGLLHDAARVQRDLGQLEEGVASIERALNIAESVYGPSSHQVGLLLGVLSGFHMWSGDSRGALEVILRGVKMLEAELGPNHQWVGFQLGGMGSAQYDLGDFEPALASFRRSYAIALAVFGEGRPELRVPLTGQGLVMQAQGDFEGAILVTEERERIFTEMIGGGTDNRATRRKLLAAVSFLAELKQQQGTVTGPDLEKVRDGLQVFENLAADSRSITEQLVVVRALVVLGRTQEARAQLQSIWDDGYRSMRFVSLYEKHVGNALPRVELIAL